MIIQQNKRIFVSATAVSGLWLMAACGGTQSPATESAGSSKKGESGLSGESSGKINAAGAEQLVKVQKRDISDEDRADFEKVMARYQAARKAGKVEDQCDSLASSFSKVADSSPNLVEARFNQGAVLQECGQEDDAVRIWEKMPKYGPAITNLGYVAWRKGDTGRAESMFNRAVEIDPLHTIEARNNIAQLLRDRARKASSDSEKKGYIGQAVTHLRTVLALDSNNLQAFATLAFIYYDMNMLEMSKLVGNQAIKKGEEIATGKFDEEKTEEKGAGGDKGGGKKAKREKAKKSEKAESGGEEDDGKLAKEVNVAGEGTGYTQSMKENLALVFNTMGLVELKRKKISPAIGQFKKSVEMNPKLAEARLNLAALSLNNRDYKTAEENFRAVLGMQPKNYEAAIGLGVALRGNKKIDEAEAQYNAAQKLDSSNPASYYNLGLLYQDYKGGDKPVLQKAQEYYRQFLSKVTGSGSDSFRRDAEKRIKDIDEIYVALAEAAKMQAEAEEMQRKAEEQQKKMEEEMKKMEAAEAKAKADAGGAAPKDGAPAAAGGTQPPPANGAAPAAGAAPASGGGVEGKAEGQPAEDADKGKKKKKK